MTKSVRASSLPSVATVSFILAFALGGFANHFAHASVVVIGHRGNSVIAPENTISAVDAAVGTSWAVELDTRVTTDGQIVLMHDSTVDRTTDGSGSIESKSFAQVRALDAGSWFAPEYAGEQIPTLIEAVSRAADAGMVSCLDIKSGPAQTYVDLLQDYKDVVEIHSFSLSFLAQVHAIDDSFTLVNIGSGDLASKINSSEIPTYIDKVSWNYGSLNETGVQTAQASGKQVYCWTVNDSSLMRAVADMGIDGLITDNTPLAEYTLNQTPIEPSGSLPYRLRDRMIMQWTFDDGLAAPTTTTVVDSVQDINATLTPGVEVPDRWVDTAGGAKFGGALEFDGVDDAATIPPLPATAPDANAVSIATWVKLDKLPSELSAGYAGIYDSTEDAYVLYMDSGAQELRFKVTTLASARPGIPQSQLDTTQWHHVAGVYDGGAGVARIYLDGELMDMHADDSSGSDGLLGYIKLQAAAFGKNGANDDHYLDGKIDDTGVWCRALSQNEIAHLYNDGTGRTIAAENPMLAAVDPVVRLQFDGDLTNQGSGGAAYNGTLVDGPDGSNAFAQGVEGQSLQLTNPDANSGGDFISIPYELTDAGTISLWCKPSGFYDYQTVFDNSIDANKWEMWVYETGVLRFRIEGDSYVSFDLDLLEGSDAWYNMAVTWFRTGNDVVANLFVDGILRDVDEGAWIDPGDTFFLAGGHTGNDHANASFDDLRIFDTVLTSDELLAIAMQKEPGDFIAGDANGDGIVDDGDAAILAENWLITSPATWSMGDFNGDGAVNDIDASILAANWQTAIPEQTVPEPSTLAGLLSLCLAGLLASSRRKP